MYKYIVLIVLFSLTLPTQDKKSDCPSPLTDESPSELLIQGYCDQYGYYYPSLITNASARRSLPDLAFGHVTWVNPHIMEATAESNHIRLEGYLDGIALMSCSDIGETVYLKRPDQDWEGPYVVADCANPKHMFAAICYKSEIAELGFETAVRWGLATYENETITVINNAVVDVQVSKSSPPKDGDSPIDYRAWWLSKLKFKNGEVFSEMGFEC